MVGEDGVVGRGRETRPRRCEEDVGGFDRKGRKKADGRRGASNSAGRDRALLRCRRAGLRRSAGMDKADNGENANALKCQGSSLLKLITNSST